MERPNVESSSERQKPVQEQDVAAVLVEEAEVGKEAQRDSQRRFGSAMMLGTVLAGMLAMPAEGEEGRYTGRRAESYEGRIAESEEFQRYGQGRRGLSSEWGRRITSGVLDAAERMQGQKAEQARHMYDQLFTRLERLVREIHTRLERIDRRVQGARTQEEAQRFQQEGNHEVEPLLKEQRVLEPLVQEASRKAQQEAIKLDILRGGRSVVRR